MTNNITVLTQEQELQVRVRIEEAENHAVKESFSRVDTILSDRATILEQRAFSLQGADGQKVTDEDQKSIDGCYHRSQELHLVLEQFEKLSVEDILPKGE